MNETGSPEESQARQFTELFTANYGPVLAYVRRRVGADLAQDVVADTFLAAWRNIHELAPDPLPWLYRAAHFAVANQRRTLARRREVLRLAACAAGPGLDTFASCSARSPGRWREGTRAFGLMFLIFLNGPALRVDANAQRLMAAWPSAVEIASAVASRSAVTSASTAGGRLASADLFR